MEQKNLVICTLHAAVDFIVKDSGVDVCKICTYYNEESQSRENERDENCDPCVWHRKHGDVACREGVIEHFQMELTK